MGICRRGLCQQPYRDDHMTWPLSPSCRCVRGHGQRLRQGIARGWKLLHLYSSCQNEDRQPLLLPSITAKEGPALPPEWFRTCQELETEETRPEAKNPQSLFHGNEKQVALITLDTKYLLPLKANPTLAGIASPPPRHPTPLYSGLSIRLISLIWQILITLIRAVLNRPD